MRGLTREILSLFSWIVAATLTYVLHPSVKPLISTYVSNSSLADIITAAVLLIAFLILFSLISQSIAQTIRNSFFGGVDRTFGLVFGFSRALLMICGMEIAISLFVPRATHAKILQTACFAPYVYSASDVIRQFIPPSLYEILLSQASKHQSPMRPVLETQSSSAPSQQPSSSPSLNQSPHEITSIKTNDALINKVLSPLPPPQPIPSQQLSSPLPFAPLSGEKKVKALAQLKPQTPSQEQRPRTRHDRMQQRELDRLLQTLDTEQKESLEEEMDKIEKEM